MTLDHYAVIATIEFFRTMRSTSLICENEMDDDWLKAARLKKKAKKGDKKAQRELDRMEKTKLVKVT